MFPFWKKKAPPQNVREQELASPLSRFTPFRANVYEAKHLPTPGTQNYAYENLGLVEFSPIGPAVANRGFIRPFQPPSLFAMQGYWPAGIPGVAGGLYSSPLINPDGLDQ